MIRKLNLPQLLDVLRDLDKDLEGTPITIRAVGGFALAWHDVRADGLTADIDSLTDDYPEEVQQAIAKTGAKHGLDPWWLNNDAAASDAQWLIESLGLKWERVECGFENITLFVADLESLLVLKLAALEDSELSGRTHDLDDVIRILLSLGYAKDDFKRKYRYLQEEQPFAYRAICRASW